MGFKQTDRNVVQDNVAVGFRIEENSAATGCDLLSPIA
jgi:hypothetical protein